MMLHNFTIDIAFDIVHDLESLPTRRLLSEKNKQRTRTLRSEINKNRIDSRVVPVDSSQDPIYLKIFFS